ncbi:hypothetical protein GCM10027055_13730 [Janibacter alkaliphilus]
MPTTSTDESGAKVSGRARASPGIVSVLTLREVPRSNTWTSPVSSEAASAAPSSL